MGRRGCALEELTFLLDQRADSYVISATWCLPGRAGWILGEKEQAALPRGADI